MKRLLSALCLWLAFANTAFAQSFPKPPDVPAYTTINATYAAGSTANVRGDGSNSWGGTPPAYAYQNTDIPTPNRLTAGWISTGTWASDHTGFCPIDGVSCPEPKVRLHANFSHVLYDDPIRNYGQPGTSHCHTFFGNQGANAYSTYASVRNRSNSTSAGGKTNGTAYWYPCVVKTVSAVDYAVKPDFMVIYYNMKNLANSQHAVKVPRGFRYVGGYPMDDPDDSQLKKEIAAANAQPGTAGRYSYETNGVVGWRCNINDTNSPYAGTVYYTLQLKNANGTDGFTGISPTNSCPVSTSATLNQLAMVIDFPECWDGTNLWSPGGYKHLRQKIRDNVLSLDVCPNGWYELPALEIAFFFTWSNSADYMSWRLSSDDGAQSKLNSLPTCTAGYANAPCNDGGGTRTVLNGQSFHTDWLGGWDYTTMDEWMTNCLGLMGGTPHQCETSIISATHALNYGTSGSPMPDGRIVSVTISNGTASTANMVKLGTAHKGPMTMHNHM